jgi:hypothetical protein
VELQSHNNGIQSQTGPADGKATQFCDSPIAAPQGPVPPDGVVYSLMSVIFMEC